MYHFYALISRMKHIERWALMRNTDPENVQEHSHMTAILAHALAVIENQRFDGHTDPGQVAAAALYHDASEIITGDMPTPIKYFNPSIRDSFQTVEDAANDRLLSMLPEELREVYAPLLCSSDPDIHRLVKAADKLSAYIKCVQEVKAGNTEFRRAKEQTWAALIENSFPALDCFIREFLPSFELTLDEQN